MKIMGIAIYGDSTKSGDERKNNCLHSTGKFCTGILLLDDPF